MIEIRVLVLAILGAVLLVAGVLSGDLGKSALGAAVLIGVASMVYIGTATDRARQTPGSPWSRRDTAVVAAGSVLAVVAIGAAVISVIR